MNNMVEFKLIDILEAKYLGGRLDGKFIREKIEGFLAENPQGKVILDFEEIVVASHSFIDEIIGSSVRAKGKDFLNYIKIRNANSSIKTTIRTILNDALKKVS